MQTLTQNEFAEKEHAIKSAAYLKTTLGNSWIPAVFQSMPGYPMDNGISNLPLADEVAEKLLEISKADWINVAAIMSVATQLLVHSYVSSDNPLSLGVSIPGADQLPRCWLLLNLAPESEQKLSDLIKGHRSTSMEALQYGFLSFSDIRRHAAVDRSTPITGIHLALGHDASLLTQPDSVQIELATLGLGRQLVFRANGLSFPSSYRESILENLQHILGQICAKPTAEVKTVTLTHPRNAMQTLALAQGPICDFTENLRLEQVLEQRALDMPEKDAIIDVNGTLTYAELNAQANGIAHKLIGLGVLPGQVVAVMVPRGAAMLAAIYGVLKAGAAYVPIDPNYPENRRSYILQDSGAFVLLKDGANTVVHDEGVLCIDVAECSFVAANPVVEKNATDIAYLIYTSGSTGNPKGVMIEHRSAFNRIEWMQNQFGLSASDVILQKTPVSFDVSVWELFWWPFAGASVVLLAPGAEKEPTQILGAIKQHQVTHMHFVPTMLDAFLNDLELEPQQIIGAALRIVFTSGEALTMHQSSRFFALIGNPQGSRLVNLYGPTEATVDVTWYECFAGDTKASVPIGQPIQNTQIYIVDKNGQPTSMGVPGELCIGGVNLARGYLNRGELTAEKFCQLPLPDSRRVYRSGDLVRWLADGQIEYLGRIDHQVKIRGYRIELGEIETALLCCPGIVDIRVIPRSREDGSRYLAAYAVTNSAYHEAVVREQLLSNLPEFMVPPFIIEVESFPLTPNGKLDRTQLPDPYQQKSRTKKTAPTNALEQTLADIWSEVLGVKDPGIHDSFFSLGGDSISFLAVISHARKTGLAISFQELFQYPTISQLAPFVRQVQALDEVVYQPFSLLSAQDRALLPPELEDAYPMTALQAGLIFQSELLRGASWYHDIQSYNLRGQFDHAAFEQAMQWMVDEYPIFRTSYQLSQHEVFVQYIHQSAALPLFISDWRDLDEDQQAVQLEAFFEHESHHRFNWAEPGLIRVHIHVLSEERFRYLLSFHDSALDGWSINRLHTRLLSYYHMARRGEAPEDQFQDNFMRKYLLLEQATRDDPVARNYWKNALADFEAMPIPRPAREKQATPTIDYFDIEIEPALSQAIRALASSSAVPVKTVLLACHLRVLGMVCNRRQIITGYEHSGRPEELNAEQSVGLFLNSVPYQLKLAPQESWRKLIGRVHAKEAEFLPYRRFPMADMKTLLGTTEILFETVFNFTHFHMLKELTTLPGMDELTVKVRAETEFPLRAEFGQDAYTDEVRLSLHYYSNEFELAQISRIANYYKAALQQLAATPDENYLTHSLLDQQELAQLITLGQGPVRKLEDETAITHIQRVIGQQPKAIALQDGHTTLSYAELAMQTEKLAALLPSGRQHVIGLALPRSVAWVAAIYAIMAKGDIYLPLDLDLPDARLQELIAQSDVAAIVCSAAQQARLATLVTNKPVQLVSVDSKTFAPASAVVELCTTPQDLAYIMFTSGSTGTPKGAQLEHAGMLNHMQAKIEDLALSAADVLAQTAPVTFDVSVWQALTGLVVGARTVIYDKEIQLDPAQFIARLNSDGVTLLEVVPSWFAVVLDYLENNTAEPRFNSLRTLVLTGEALKLELINRWFALQPDIALVNAYGPTEASDDITHCLLRQPVGNHIVPVGRPVRNLRLHILNEYDRPVPLGTPGEICVSGIGVGRGYINAPDKTLAAFDFDHPLAQWSNGRLYRTGDLGYWLEDGNLAYLGRKDEQVKVRGMRIELGEIENALLAITSVRDAAVVFDPTNANLTGFVCGTKNISAIQKELLGKLPLHMVPERLLMLESLPLSRAGKVDKKALLQIAAAHVDDVREVEPLATKLEAELALLWADALKIDVALIGRDSNFFALGGNSLLAMLAAMRSAGRFNIADLFEQRTLAALANHVGQADQATNVLRLLTAPGKDVALVCFSYAAGNSVNFLAVAEQLPAGVSLYGVESPGNDPSTGESFIALPELVSRSIAELQQRGIRKVIPWGHCSGAAGAVELVRQAQTAGIEIAGAIVSGKLLRDEVQLQAQIRHTESMSDKAIVSWLVDTTGFALDGQPWLTSHLAAAFRNDAIGANHVLNDLWQTSSPLMEKPLLCLIASDDPLTTDYMELTNNWKRFSSQLTTKILDSGGHYFIKSKPSDVVAAVQVLLN